MAKEVTMWECSTCGSIGEEDVIKECEACHIELENLQVNDLAYCEPSGEFPDAILIENKEKSGRMALYKKMGEESVEEYVSWREWVFE